MRKSIIRISSTALAIAVFLSGCSNAEIVADVASIDAEYYELSTEEVKETPQTVEETAPPTEETTEKSLPEPIISETDDGEIYSFLSGSFKVQARNALLYDVDGGRILFGKNADKKAFPASITKIITIMTALEYISSNTAITVGTEVNLPEAGSSLAYLAPGQELSLQMLIYALLLPSGNDAAYTVAVNVARIAAEDMSLSDTEAADYFAELMNKFAKKIGAKNTHFSCCDGFHRDDHYTTAEDLMLFVKKAMEYKAITDVCRQSEATVTFLSGEYATWYNSNALIYSEGERYLDYVTGMKTGFTDEAGYCYVGTAEKDGHRLIVVTLGCKSIDSRWDDAASLFEAGFEYVTR